MTLAHFTSLLSTGLGLLQFILERKFALRRNGILPDGGDGGGGGSLLKISSPSRALERGKNVLVR